VGILSGQSKGELEEHLVHDASPCPLGIVCLDTA
jgi:hypothetical protein